MVKNCSQPILSSNIKHLRKVRRLTQADLAEQIEKTTEMVCQLETGVTCTRVATLDLIADALDVETYQLFLKNGYPDIGTFSPELLELIEALNKKPRDYVVSLLHIVNETAL